MEAFVKAQFFLLLLLLLGVHLCSCAAASPETKERFVSGLAPVDSAQLYFERQGEGSAVVLLHGGEMDSRIWDAQFGEFAEHYDVIRYDARGYGRSSPVDTSFQAHEDLLHLLNFLDIERAHLVGLSLGGRIAIDFALTCPQRTLSLCLAGPGISGWSWSVDDHPYLSEIRQAADAGNLDEVTRLWLQSPFLAPAMERPHLQERLEQLVRENAKAWLDPNLEMEMQPPALGRLSELWIPVFVLLGERDVADIHQIVDVLTTSIPHAKLARFPGAGHMLNLENPERFNESILSFLRNAEARN